MRCWLELPVLPVPELSPNKTGHEATEPTVKVVHVPDAAMNRDVGKVIAALKKRLRVPECDWKAALLEAVAQWPLADEDTEGQRLDYLIGGEAFDWRLLALRLAGTVGDALPPAALNSWINDPDPAGGFAEAEFTRLLGVEKYRSHLNYFYGVTVERALLASVEAEVTKRQVALGVSATERSRDEAFERLYEAPYESPWPEFCAEDKERQRGESGPKRDHASLADVDAFTYWLFKRRMKLMDPARLASDTRKGLTQFERMRVAQERRLLDRLTERAVPNASEGALSREGAGENPRPVKRRNRHLQ